MTPDEAKEAAKIYAARAGYRELTPIEHARVSQFVAVRLRRAYGEGGLKEVDDELARLKALMPRLILSVGFSRENDRDWITLQLPGWEDKVALTPA